ncbi:hypothetical protein BKA70DRAFT_1429902 [Coprinopsis sp. MPI-PUGE-AT-0042]|nr:hypothetical protein BKA70DRAFT_1429902 [Coprinopsis sp. MPI-PUGE-AT-0042]
MSAQTPRISPAEYLARLDYLPSGNILANVGWHGSGGFNYLTHVGSRERGILTMVGMVSPERLHIDTGGNYNPRFNQMKKAKFQFSLTAPALESPFHAHFTQGLHYLRQLQTSVAKTADKHRYMLVVEGGEGGLEAIRFSQDMFRRRSVPLNAYDTTDATMNWPIPNDHVRALMEIAPTFSIRPMLAYDMDDRLINPSFMATMLPGAMVEVSFSVRHMNLKEDNDTVDIFTAMFEQVRVIQNPPAEEADPFRANVSLGPLIGGVRVHAAGASPATPAATTGSNTATMASNTAVAGHQMGRSFNAVMAGLNRMSTAIQPIAKTAGVGSTTVQPIAAVVGNNTLTSTVATPSPTPFTMIPATPPAPSPSSSSSSTIGAQPITTCDPPNLSTSGQALVPVASVPTQSLVRDQPLAMVTAVLQPVVAGTVPVGEVTAVPTTIAPTAPASHGPASIGESEGGGIAGAGAGAVGDLTGGASSANGGGELTGEHRVVQVPVPNSAQNTPTDKDPRAASQLGATVASHSSPSTLGDGVGSPSLAFSTLPGAQLSADLLNSCSRKEKHSFEDCSPNGAQDKPMTLDALELPSGDADEEATAPKEKKRKRAAGADVKDGLARKNLRSAAGL